jgi:hypothetical protein
LSIQFTSVLPSMRRVHRRWSSARGKFVLALYFLRSW